MQSVPETETMKFRPSPTPSSSEPDLSPYKPNDLHQQSSNGDTMSTPTRTFPAWVSQPPRSRLRTASPLSHMRSGSMASLTSPLNAPQMNRTRSLPGVNVNGHISYLSPFQQSSPAGSPRKPFIDEAFPAAYPSSVSSTPTSSRSRSPSISSLETILDSPDAEEAALEAERMAQLNAAADAADGGESKGRNSLDVPARGRTLGFGSRDKRKRWSVCGAERRGDLDLETIWED
jgi:hypothetical protein